MSRFRCFAPLTCLVSLLIAACSQAPSRPHASMAVNAEPLRSTFNRDVGKVRIVMVAAPT